ncbi:MAG: restriction endonuclease subunit S, partial [Bacteroidota bacterium]
MPIQEKDRRLVPELRFGEFEEEWEKDKIRNLAKIKSGGTPSRGKVEYWNGDIPWVTTSLVNFNKIIVTEEYITKFGLDNSSAQLFNIGTIIIAMYGQGKTRGKVATLGIDAATNQACAAIIENKKLLNKDYLFQVLYGNYDRIRRFSNQGGQQNLSAKLIKNIKITFPTLPEQQKIATFLTAVDRRIQLLQEKATHLQAYKKGMMQQLFSRQLRFKDEDGKDFGEWEEKRLGELMEFKNGINASKEDYGKGYKFINVLDIIENDFITYDVIKGAVNIDSGIFEKNIVSYGDVLFQRSSETREEVGQANVYVDKEKEATFGGFVIRGKKIGEYDPILMNYILKTENSRKEIIAKSGGSTRYNVSQSILSEVRIIMPSILEQQKIANFLSKIDERIALVENHIEQMQTLILCLFQKMLVLNVKSKIYHTSKSSYISSFCRIF